MSGVFKAVGKVFKSVVKVVKKVLPVALMAAAVYFTGGAALGVAGTAGGWGAAVSSLTSQMGATGILGNVLTGAITQAGYGAVLGAGTSLLTGGDPLKGAATGALGGAITGGVSGGLGLGTDPLSGIGEGAASGAPGAVEQLGNLPPPGLDASAVEAGVKEGLWAAPASSVSAPVQAAAGTAPAAASGNPGLLSPGGWIERNQTLVGNTISGLGQGLLKGSEIEDERDALIARDNNKFDQVRANYGSTGPGLLRPGSTDYIAGQEPRPTPAQRFDPTTYGGRYVFNPQTGLIDYVRNG